MVDSRISKTAEIIMEHSTKVKKGDSVLIWTGFHGKALALEIYKLALLKGAHPNVKVALPEQTYTYYKYATIEQLKNPGKIALYEIKNSDVVIFISDTDNTKQLSNVDPSKISIRLEATKQILIERLKKRWVLVGYPTNAFAQDAEMSLQEYEDFVFNAINIDWKKESKRQDILKEIIDNAKDVQVIGKNTDLKFSIKGKKAKKCAGEFNLPDGEVFTEPVKNSVSGYITYDFPAVWGGREVSGIRLDFKNGKVVKATAKKGEDFLKKMINTDKGSAYIGEFGIGVNYGIKKFIKNILFDEKIGGTVHFALGNAYEETGGENKSAIHWDMIKDLRKGGKIIIDGKVIQENGKFKIKM